MSHKRLQHLTITSKVLELIHLDLMVPMQVESQDSLGRVLSERSQMSLKSSGLVNFIIKLVYDFVNFNHLIVSSKIYSNTNRLNRLVKLSVNN